MNNQTRTGIFQEITPSPANIGGTIVAEGKTNINAINGILKAPVRNEARALAINCLLSSLACASIHIAAEYRNLDIFITVGYDPLQDIATYKICLGGIVKKPITMALIAAMIAGLLISIISCTETVYVTVTPSPTPTNNSTPIPSPTTAPTPSYLSFIEQGNEYLEQGEWGEAARSYSDAISLNPEYAEAYAGKALARVELENYRLGFGWDYSVPVADCEKALELDPCIELDPKVAKAYVEMGDEYNENGEYDEALTLYTRAIEIDPSIDIDSKLLKLYRALAEHYGTLCYDYAHCDSTYDFCEDYGAKEMCDFAIAYWNKVYELDPEISSYVPRGEIWDTMCRYYYDLAVADYSKTIEVHPDYYWAYLYRGELYSWIGQKDELSVNLAIDDLRMFLTLFLKEPPSEYEWLREYHEQLIERVKKEIQELESS